MTKHRVPPAGGKVARATWASRSSFRTVQLPPFLRSLAADRRQYAARLLLYCSVGSFPFAIMRHGRREPAQHCGCRERMPLRGAQLRQQLLVVRRVDKLDPPVLTDANAGLRRLDFSAADALPSL